MNDLTTLRARLQVQLRDPSADTWTTAELDDILTEACAQLYPRVAIPLSKPVWPLDEETEDYGIPTGILDVSSIDVCEVATDRMLHQLANGTWRLYGDVLGGAGAIQINRSYANADHYLVVHGYGSYVLVDPDEDLFPPDIYVPFILATARAEAWRTMIGERARFEKWMTLNQKENISVNELSQMIAQAENEAERQRSRTMTWRKPKPAR